MTTFPPGVAKPLAHLDDRQLTDQTCEALRAGYDDPARIDRQTLALVDAAIRRGITARRLASHARVPGGWVIERLARPQDRAEAYAAELHHLDRAQRQIHLARARDAWRLLHNPDPGRKTTKVELAATFGVSRPTLDSWLAQGDPARHTGPCSEGHTCAQG